MSVTGWATRPRLCSDTEPSHPGHREPLGFPGMTSFVNNPYRTELTPALLARRFETKKARSVKDLASSLVAGARFELTTFGL